MTQSDDPFFVSPSFPDVPRDCPLCPRLSAFRNEHRKVQSDWHNAPVPSFGDADGRLLIVGLAPGLQGANRTGRPFTGDYAGDLLYSTLDLFGFSTGQFQARPDDGLKLSNCLITNAVRCVPPENKPTPAEQNSCRSFLISEIAAMPRLKSILVLGRIAHDAALSTLGLRKAAYPFAHGAQHVFEHAGFERKLSITDSYHCSRYNLNTGRLTEAMFHVALERAISST